MSRQAIEQYIEDRKRQRRERIFESSFFHVPISMWDTLTQKEKDNWIDTHQALQRAQARAKRHDASIPEKIQLKRQFYNTLTAFLTEHARPYRVDKYKNLDYIYNSLPNRNSVFKYYFPDENDMYYFKH